ncbi:MAG: SoxR reducing system RseC family protein [Bacteroidales bacterium]|jgi:sigma-E factor negative regulatory protein RseC|nr:SoxR reducing system RseC family protein [Bacteroidales bacterium]
MSSKGDIEHAGVVQSIGKNSIIVRITAHPACASCHATGICSSSGTTEKFFEVPLQNQIEEGQPVMVTTSLSNGFRALLLGYLIPLAVLIISLIVMLAAGAGELVSGVGSVSSVIVYYVIIYLIRDKIAKKIKFTLKPA